MDVIQYIESTFLSGKHLTKPTQNQISSLCRAYGNDPIMYILASNEKYLFSKEYNDQAHFESTILLLLRNKVPYVKQCYKSYKESIAYNMVDEPPEIREHETLHKKERSWVF